MNDTRSLPMPMNIALRSLLAVALAAGVAAPLWAADAPPAAAASDTATAPGSPAAGAEADGETLARAGALGLDPGDYFRRSDSFTFFECLGDAVLTGPTGNNLRDLRLLLAW